MKTKYSHHWLASRQPRKQRKYRHNAPLHRRQKMMSAHLAKDLRQQYKRRSLPLRKGDEVKVLRGEFKGLYGKVEKIDLQNLKVKIENVKRRKASGEEVAVSIDPSNLLVMKLDMNDKKRFAGAKKGA